MKWWNKFLVFIKLKKVVTVVDAVDFLEISHLIGGNMGMGGRVAKRHTEYRWRWSK